MESVTRQLNYVRASMHDDGDDTSGDNSFVGRLFDAVKSYSTIDLNWDLHKQIVMQQLNSDIGWRSLVLHSSLGLFSCRFVKYSI